MNTQTTLQTLAVSYAEALGTFNECVIRCENEPLNKQYVVAKHVAYNLLCDAQNALNLEAQMVAYLKMS